MAPISVNQPMDVSKRDKSASEKLQLYGIYSAFAKGKMPSNRQIDIALNSALESTALTRPSDRLSDEGRKMLVHVREVIENAKLLVLTKNDGQLIQDFAWNSRALSDEIVGTGSEKGDAVRKGQTGPVTRESAKEDGQKVLDGLKMLGKLVITNGQFRKLLKDALILARSIAGDAASNAAKRVSPSDDEMSQIDSFAEHNSWVEPGSSSDFRSRIRDRYQKSGFGKKQVDGVDAAASDSTAGASVDSNTRAEWRDRSKAYLDKKMPAERREATLARMKQMVVEVQQHADYQDAIVTLLDLVDAYGSHSQHYAKSGHGTAMGAYQTEPAQEAKAKLKLLLERFANSTSLDDVVAAIRTLFDRARADPELRKWFSNMNQYIRKCVQKPGFIIEPIATEEWNGLTDQADLLTRQRYRGEFDRVTHELDFFIRQFDADPANRAFADSVKKLFAGLGQDATGKAAFKPELLRDLTAVVVPAFFESLSYVPVPRMEYRDRMVDVIVENLVIESDNLAPNLLEIKSDNHFRWGRKTTTSANKNKMMVALSGVQMDMRDVSYYVRQKATFPSFHDVGVVDIFIGGTGLSFLIELETADRFSTRPMPDGAHFFKATNVRVNAANMKVKIRQSRHKLILSVVKPVLLRLLKPVIMKVIGTQMKKSINQLDRTAYDVQQEVRRTGPGAPTGDGKPSTTSTYSRYVDVVKRRLEARKSDAAAKKEKAEAEARARGHVGPMSEFKMAFSHHDSLFPNIRLPAGITAKATEFRNLASQGDRWESPVFAIGNAKPSAAMAAASKPTRKSTWTGGNDRTTTVAAAAAGAGVGAAGVAAAATAATSRRDRPMVTDQPISNVAESNVGQHPDHGHPVGRVGPTAGLVGVGTAGQHTPPSSHALNLDHTRPGSDYDSSKLDFDYVDENSIPMYADQATSSTVGGSTVDASSPYRHTTNTDITGTSHNQYSANPSHYANTNQTSHNIPATIDTRATIGSTDPRSTMTGHTNTVAGMAAAAGMATKAGRHSNTSSMADTPMFQHSIGSTSAGHPPGSAGSGSGYPNQYLQQQQNQQHNIIPSALPPSPQSNQIRSAGSTNGHGQSQAQPGLVGGQTGSKSTTGHSMGGSPGVPGGMPSSQPETPVLATSHLGSSTNIGHSTGQTTVGATGQEKLYFQQPFHAAGQTHPDAPSNPTSQAQHQPSSWTSTITGPFHDAESKPAY